MDAGPVAEAVALLRAGVDGLLAASLSAESSVEVVQLLGTVEAQRRRLEAVDQRVLAEVAERGIAGEYARCSPTDLLVAMLRVSPSEAKSRVARARDLGPRRTVIGEPLDPILPATAAASAAGEISGAHATVITKCIEQIPAEIAHEAAPVAERMLVEAARHEHPALLATTARMLLMRLDPDGAEPRDAEMERKRGYGLRKFADGSSTPYGRFDPEVTAMWEAVLDSLAAPLPAADGMADDRTPSQRRHDAMGEAARRLLGSDTLPSTGGTPVTVMATITMQELIDKAGVATTTQDSPLSAQKLL
ncbi:MAG: DUF222 domain-containing protein, partial [Jatrophihabitans sp.]|uniref:DUF222 domain-containing protein n=1 Tax=Jatrophihabitans sp. TaxID=1932789 RepID=UPI00390F5B90